jgi:hypothetical protein
MYCGRYVDERKRAVARFVEQSSPSPQLNGLNRLRSHNNKKKETPTDSSKKKKKKKKKMQRWGF